MTPDAVDQQPVDALLLRSAATLRGFADRIEGGALLRTLEWTIPMADIGTDRMEAHCNAIAEAVGRRQHAIYVIGFDDEVPLERVYEVVDGHKAQNKLLPAQERRAFARVNKRKGCLGSRCLYVGVSEKVVTRLRQHLIEAHPSTFAIHMKYWPSDIAGNLVVKLYRITNVPSVLVPFIEDQLAREMPPILGRRGSV